MKHRDAPHRDAGRFSFHAVAKRLARATTTRNSLDLFDFGDRHADHSITSLDDLAALYPNPIAPASIAKEIDHVDANYAALIAASPFFLLATNGPDGPGLLAARGSCRALLRCGTRKRS